MNSNAYSHLKSCRRYPGSLWQTGAAATSPANRNACPSCTGAVCSAHIMDGARCLTRMCSCRIPFLYEQAFQWYTSFDPLGELIDRPNPTPALELMDKVIAHLTKDCAWPPHRIHFFGFAQGGTVAAEYALKFWRAELSPQQKSLPPSGPDTSSQHETAPRAFGSIVSVSGPLLSYPTPPKPCPTPVLIFHRPPPAESALPSGAIAALKKGFTKVDEVKMKGEGMPRSKDEFEPIMRFWSEHLGRRQMDGLYEVISGMAPP